MNSTYGSAVVLNSTGVLINQTADKSFSVEDEIQRVEAELKAELIRLCFDIQLMKLIHS